VGVEADCRPRAAQVLEHPYFWDEKRRTDFILEFSDRLSGKNRDPHCPVVERVESNAAEICGKDWTRVVDDALMKESKVNRKYVGQSVNDLMRLIRNKVPTLASLL
jgi:serine/threonine-protein kinase/endoribonuclease IRE1